MRPDRLPPEYEPQPQANHHVVPTPRPPMYTYHNMSGGGHAAFTLPGHLTPSTGPAWLPGQLPSQRPPQMGHGGQQMYGGMSMPGLSLSPHTSSYGHSGPSSLPHSQSPSSIYGSAGLPLPLSGQNTGSHPYLPLGASPLAGSLTTGMGPGSMIGFNPARRESLTPFSHGVSPDASNISLPRSTSPAPHASISTSRRTSSINIAPASNHLVKVPSDLGTAPSHRAPQPGHLGQIPSPPLANGKSTVSSADESLIDPLRRPSVVGHTDISHAGTNTPPTVLPPSVPIAMEGLAHHGAVLGPPSTLHDRVVFVSNVSHFRLRHTMLNFPRTASLDDAMARAEGSIETGRHHHSRRVSKAREVLDCLG